MLGLGINLYKIINFARWNCERKVKGGVAGNNKGVGNHQYYVSLTNSRKYLFNSTGFCMIQCHYICMNYQIQVTTVYVWKACKNMYSQVFTGIFFKNYQFCSILNFTKFTSNSIFSTSPEYRMLNFWRNLWRHIELYHKWQNKFTALSETRCILRPINFLQKQHLYFGII